MKHTPSLLKSAVWILALLLAPLLIVRFVPQMHGMDIATYNAWYDSFRESNESLLNLYKTSYTNYPLLGNMASIGVLGLIKTYMTEANTNFWVMAEYFRYSMSLFDFLSGTAIFIFLTRRQFSYAGFASLFFVLTPSTWAASGVWGQIDGFSNFIMMVTLMANIAWAESLHSDSQKKYVIYAFLSVMGSVALLFTKQTSIFALPYLGVLTLYNYTVQWNAGNDNHKTILTAIASLALVTYSTLDFTFNMPNGFKSQLAYIWLGGGSNHGNELSLNGFNFWILSGESMRSSSLTPIFLGLSAKQIGLGLFAIFTVYLMTRFVKLLKNTHKTNNLPKELRSGHIAILVALSQLGFNLILTGAHERYLYHFYPIAGLGLLLLFKSKQLRLSNLVMFAAGSVSYGLFVWSTLFHPDDITTRPEHYIMLVTHLFLFGFLIIQDYRLSKIEAEFKTSEFDKIFEVAKKLAS